MLKSFVILALALASQSSAFALDNAAPPTCSKNACLRVVKLNKKQGGNQGCSAFFRTTVIPATSTSTTTVKVPRTVTKTITSVDTTVTTDYAGTTTSTSTDVEPETTTKTITSTATITETTTLPYSGNNRLLKRAKPAKATTTSQTTVPSYASACANTVDYSSACSCISVTHTTTTLDAPMTTKTVTRSPLTVTTTVLRTSTTSVSEDPGTTTLFTTLTVTSTATTTETESDSVTTTQTVTSASPTCGNLGAGWAYYNYQTGGSNPPYNGFYPEDYKSMNPSYDAVVHDIGGFASLSNPSSIYGSSEQLRTTNFVLNERGWLYIAKAGQYTIAITNVDDIVDFWSGAKAYSGWTRANADLEVQYSSGGGHGSTVVTFAKGYNPFRTVYVNTVAGASFNIKISDADGNVVAQTGSGDTNIIQFGCLDDDNAPVFPPFGSET